MNEARTEKLKKARWKLGTPKEFLRLTDEEAALIEIKLGRREVIPAASRQILDHVTGAWSGGRIHDA